MTSTKKDSRIDKRRVTMRNYIVIPQEGSEPRLERHEAVDYVRPDFLEAYVTEAKLRWQTVDVSDEPDAGPGGYDGATTVPHTLDHPLHGQTFAATTEGN